MFLDLHVGNLIEPLTGRRWTPADLHMRVEARIGALAAAGLAHGDHAFIHFPRETRPTRSRILRKGLPHCPAAKKRTETRVRNLL